MKKAILMICLLAGAVTYAQSGSGIGLKGGLNFGANGDASIRENLGNIGSDSKVGFHLGVFGKMDFGTLYFRPELVYTKLNSEYDYDTGTNKFEMSKLDMPLLVGLNILGPLHIFAGPSLQYILDTELENIELEDVKNDFTVGLNIGAGVNLSDQLGVDLRFERGFSDNEAEFSSNEEFQGRVDTRPSQLILGLSYKF
ncbi:porin family protein [Galbibacter sp.]|jgi:opacity protein-like surface antigen|uniref:porin family protein n=1 Tax=Galbibacter sp. TaxID=2918471 RepID=UPI003A8F373D